MVSITRPEAIDAVTQHLGTVDPIDGRTLLGKSEKFIPESLETINNGCVVSRMVFHPKRRGSTWNVTVWETYHDWVKDKSPKRYAVDWPGTVEFVDTKAMSPKPNNHPIKDRKVLTLRLRPWWWIQINTIGHRWFKSGQLSKTAQHLLKTQVVTDLARNQASNQALYARPHKKYDRDGVANIHWEIVDPLSDEKLGAGPHELDAWRACCRHLGIECDDDPVRVWRAPNPWVT